MKTFVIALAMAAFATGGFAADVPRKAPELAITLPTGGQVKLSSYQGKVVVLAFIVTT